MGNHDPVARRDLGGEWQQDWCCRGLVLRHDPVLAATGEVAGHLHPCARVVRNGLSQRRPCFVFNSQRVILPAFGAYAGGLNVLAPAASRLFADQPSVAVVGRSGIYLVATEQLRPD
jgi:metallophosphoesterase superfamily enzyme